MKSEILGVPNFFFKKHQMHQSITLQSGPAVGQIEHWLYTKKRLKYYVEKIR